MAKSILVSLALLAGVLVNPGLSFAQHRPTHYKVLGISILKRINDYRAGKGLPPMKMDDVITESAAHHSQAMATGKRPFGHDGFNNRMASLKKQIPSGAWAENVAYGSDDPQEIVDMWLHSDGHRKNIEGNYDITGIGVYPGSNGTYYYTQIFIKQDK